MRSIHPRPSTNLRGCRALADRRTGPRYGPPPGKLATERPTHAPGLEDFSWNDESRNYVLVGPFLQRKRFVSSILVVVSEGFNGSSGYAELQEHLTIRIRYPLNCADDGRRSSATCETRTFLTRPL